MLLVAQPKTASSSFNKTLSSLLGVKNYQYIPRPMFPCPPEFDTMQFVHSDVGDYGNTGILKHFAADAHVFKQHIPPTFNNLKELEDTKIIIILRPPEETMASYERSIKSGTWDYRPKQFELMREELALAIHNFYHGWEKMRGNPNWLYLYKDDIVGDIEDALRQVNHHFGLKLPLKGVKLAKLRYNKTFKPGKG